jgi:hypothetical protein
MFATRGVEDALRGRGKMKRRMRRVDIIENFEHYCARRIPRPASLAVGALPRQILVKLNAAAGSPLIEEGRVVSTA